MTAAAILDKFSNKTLCSVASYDMKKTRVSVSSYRQTPFSNIPVFFFCPFTNNPG